MDETKPKLTWRDILRMVFRRRRMFVLGASLIAIVVLIASPYGWNLEYTGTTIFQRSMDPAAEERAGSFESIKLTLEHELRGRKAVTEAIRAEPRLARALIGGGYGRSTARAMSALTQRLMKNIQVRWTVRSQQVDLISVSFTHDDPDLAQSVPNTLVRNYIAKVHDKIVDDLDKSLKFLKERVSDVDTRLDRAIKGRTVFEGQHAGKITADPGIFERQMQEINADIDTVRRLQEVATQQRDKLKTMQDSLKDNPDEPSQVVRGPNPKLDELKKELDASKDELKKLEDVLDAHLILSHMTEKHPTVQTLRKKIAKVEKEVEGIKEEIEETPEEAVLQRVFGKDSLELTMKLASAQSAVDLASGELKRLEKRLEGPQALVTGYPPIRQEYLEHLRRCDELEGEKANWQKRLTDIQMALSAEVAKRRTHLEAVQMAEKQFLPSSPKLLVVLGFALAGGLVVGGGLVFLCDTIDRSISTKQDAAKHFNLPVCGVIDEILTPWQRLKRRARQWGVEPLVALILVAIIGVASLNIVLWLHRPEEHKQWKDDPTAFVGRKAASYYQKAVQELKGRFP